MPDIGDTWHPSMPFPLTDREIKEKRDQKKEEDRDRNRLKNDHRRQAKELRGNIPKKRLEAGKNLRHAFGGAFGHAPENVKFMAAQGTTMIPENTLGENVDLEIEGDDENG